MRCRAAQLEYRAGIEGKRCQEKQEAVDKDSFIQDFLSHVKMRYWKAECKYWSIEDFIPQAMEDFHYRTIRLVLSKCARN